MRRAVGGAGFERIRETGTPDDERRTDATFIEHAFGAPELTRRTGADFGPVVGADENQRVIAQRRIRADPVEEFAELSIHRLEDRVVETSLAVAPLLHRRPKWTVHVIRPEIHVKRFLVARGSVDERERGIGKAGRDLGTLHPGHRLTKPLGVGPNPLRLVIAGLEGERKELGPHALEVCQRGVETIGRDRRSIVDVALAAHVPLAEMARGIAGVAQHAREHRGLRIEPLGHAARAVLSSVVEEGRDAPALWILTRREADARGRTDRRGDVELLEAEALGGEAINLGRHRVLVAETGKVAPPHVVDEDHNEIGTARGSRLGGSNPESAAQE